MAYADMGRGRCGGGRLEGVRRPLPLAPIWATEPSATLDAAAGRALGVEGDGGVRGALAGEYGVPGVELASDDMVAAAANALRRLLPEVER